MQFFSLSRRHTNFSQIFSNFQDIFRVFSYVLSQEKHLYIYRSFQFPKNKLKIRLSWFIICYIWLETIKLGFRIKSKVKLSPIIDTPDLIRSTANSVCVWKKLITFRKRRTVFAYNISQGIRNENIVVASLSLFNFLRTNYDVGHLHSIFGSSY